MPLSRNSCRSGSFILRKVDDHSICSSFDCGNEDLNDYFHNHAEPHKTQLITQCYCLQDEVSGEIMALLDFCNDSVRSDDYNALIDIDDAKRYRYLPAVKITRLGVRRDLHNQNFGTQCLNMVKMFFITDNRTGCRCITVDAYKEVVGFYTKNKFKLLSRQDERKATRAMLFDLKRLELPNPSNFETG